MSKKSFILTPYENDWAGFIYDLDCSNSKSIQAVFKPGSPTTMIKDPETVQEARDSAKTVVTSNAKDFIPYTLECQKRDDNHDCQDCWGLVIVPNREFDREYALEKAQAKRGVPINGAMLPWKAAFYANLSVTITRDGRVQVSRFDRCQYCEGAIPLLEQDWYKSLPVVQRAVRPRRHGRK
ncbi:MAG TPA: hypothetical protein VMU92_06215 [Acidobacteriaceae bacterium]|nr:hypothetical protein [Acidobacteriaceae bacterium]